MIDLKNLYRAIEDKDRDAYKQECAGLVSLGYIPRITENGSVECVFIGPPTQEDKQALKDYLDNIYEALTKEPEEEEEEDDKEPEPQKATASSSLPIVGIVVVAVAALLLMHNTAKRQPSYVVS